MKHEWKKHEKEIYGATTKPQVIRLPEQKFITIAGMGDPNEAAFSERVGVLYSLAFPIKMAFKRSVVDNTEIGCNDYTVYPLEGQWTTTNPDDLQDKASFEYILMIRQSDYITEALFQETLAEVKKKKPHALLEQVNFETRQEGLCVQALHKGSFDEEPATFTKMEQFAQEQKLQRSHHEHKEIYLNDARKTAPEKRKTILRFQVVEN
ncbi:GyrI-like domain-containing protein [Candidatus Enterococcus ferrettii]|uniref:GyrI-like small molecule binding domain-containing protein n=1 Tax=Candidatus Enterococcus ferrettii TaxID=2815324 RepID=A0ABV0EVU8_9ENTE|nr:GyrI-like domain-containing protein [Enterococcus sp. 665A]MBO1341529.1 GyrI-like domain-containing protein [Enterococcus sp. 665A]